MQGTVLDAGHTSAYKRVQKNMGYTQGIARTQKKRPSSYPEGSTKASLKKEGPGRNLGR